MNQPRTWQELAQQRARQRMAEILDDICSEQEALDMLWEIYYRNGGTQVRDRQTGAKRCQYGRPSVGSENQLR